MKKPYTISRYKKTTILQIVCTETILCNNNDYFTGTREQLLKQLLLLPEKNRFVSETIKSLTNSAIIGLY